MIVVPVTAGQSEAEVIHSLGPVLAAAAQGGRVTLMTHGYRFEPGHALHCPYRHILSERPAVSHFKALSWARHLRLGRDGAPPGIGFGWTARGPLNAAYTAARTAGDRLAEVITMIATRRPDLRVNLVAHSFGARVALRALELAPEDSVDRVLLLSAAEYARPARCAATCAAGRHAQIINVTSGENAVFDLLFRALVRPEVFGDRPAAGGLADLPNWTEIRIDAAADRTAARASGFAIRPAPGRVCHWSTYLRGGVFPLYRALLDPARAHTLPRLSAALAEARPARRPLWPVAVWSMLHGQ